MRREIIQDARQADPWKTDEKTNTGNNWNAGCETKQSTVNMMARNHPIRYWRKY